MKETGDNSSMEFHCVSGKAVILHINKTRCKKKERKFQKT